MCLLAGGFVKVQWFYKMINDVSSVTLFLKIMCLIISLADYQYIKAKGQFTDTKKTELIYNMCSGVGHKHLAKLHLRKSLSFTV